jgi:type VII secretion integral membrane protein EccD
VPAPPTGLTRITVVSPQRRVDVALPDQAALVELLPELLSRAGDGLADAGEQHGGWVLRRVDGAPLPVTGTLSSAGVRDGEVLSLVPAAVQWPELEYDDVVEGIADGARGLGARWTGDATRLTAVVAAGCAVLLALLGPLRAALTTDGVTALGVATALLLAGVFAVRAFGEPLVGVALGAYALPFAFLGGQHLAGGGPADAPHLLVGAVTLVVWSTAAAVGVVRGLWIFVAGITAGVLAGAGALLAFGGRVTSAAAILLVAVVVCVTAAPPVAVRLGRLPMPVVVMPAGPMLSGDPPDRSSVLASVARSDGILTGMLAGCGLVAFGAALLLRPAGLAGWLLIGVAGTALLLRARLFVTVRQRVPLLAAGLATAAVLLWSVHADATGTATTIAGPGLAVLVIALAAAGARYRRRPPSPYVGRAADVLDTLCLVSLIPIACAVLGLYSLARGLGG